jgi:hypothetical protein
MHTAYTAPSFLHECLTRILSFPAGARLACDSVGRLLYDTRMAVTSDAGSRAGIPSAAKRHRDGKRHQYPALDQTLAAVAVLRDRRQDRPLIMLSKQRAVTRTCARLSIGWATVLSSSAVKLQRSCSHIRARHTRRCLSLLHPAIAILSPRLHLRVDSRILLRGLSWDRRYEKSPISTAARSGFRLRSSHDRR